VVARRTKRDRLTHLGSLLGSPVLDALVGLEVDLNVVPLAFSVDHLEGVPRISVDVPVALGST
jgi:hypothetical protein